MAKAQQQEDSHPFRWLIVDLSGLFLWIVVIVISIFIGSLGWTGILPKRNTSSVYIYTPESVNQILFYLGCVGLITKMISKWIKRQTLILAEVIEYFYLGLICGICFLCSLLLPISIPISYQTAKINRSIVPTAFGLAVVVVVFLLFMVIKKYNQILETKRELQFEQRFYFRQIFQHKWLFLAPIGLLALPFLFFIFDIGNGGLLWEYYLQEEWLILPIVVGTILACLWYGGEKIKSIKSEVKFRNIAYLLSGNLLIFISIGVYIILMLASLVFSVISQ